MRSIAVERRAAPRFATNCVAELASGTSVTRVQIRDMSVTGCGIEILRLTPDVPQEPGATGLLNIKRAGSTSGLMIPVVLCNMRVEQSRRHFGLQFRSLSPRLMKNVVSIMEDVFVP